MLSDFDVEYYDYECGFPCTPNGCCGHGTDIPLSFTVGGVTFSVYGAESGDFPDLKENIERVRTVVAALGKLIMRSAQSVSKDGKTSTDSNFKPKTKS